MGKEYAAKGQILGSWQEDLHRKSIDCDSYRGSIVLYEQKALDLDPLYPNWSYYYDLSISDEHLSTVSPF